VDVAHPIHAVVPTLEGPILEVLARTTRPLTGGEVHRLARSGSASGIRRALSRLADQGMVHARARATAIFYEANRDHLAWPAVELLVAMRTTLLDRLAAILGSWRPSPVHASLFGSFARGDGDTASDIDLLLVRPDGLAPDDESWGNLGDTLRDRVRAWTGNHCHVFELDPPRLAQHVQRGDPLVDSWLRDSVLLAGPELHMLIQQSSTKGGSP
jgi:predicted nucleotidyltransferase